MAHLDLVFQEARKDVVADPGGAKGVQVDAFPGQRVSEFEVQDADVGHGSSHGVADDVEVCVRVLLQQLPRRFRHVRLQRAAVVGDKEACRQRIGQLWANSCFGFADPYHILQASLLSCVVWPSLWIV